MNKLLKLRRGKPWYLSGGIRPVAVYQPFDAANLAASYVNLASPGTYDLTEGTAPTFSKILGWTFAASAYLKTGITPASGYSMIIAFRDSSTNVCLAGAFRSGAYFNINPRQATNNAILYASGGQLTINNAGAAAGILAIAGNKAYRNGVVESGTIGDWTTTAYELYVGATNNNGTATSKFNGSIQAIAVYAQTLTASQVDRIYKRLLKLIEIYRVVYDGDSLTLGTGADAGYDYPSQATAMLGYRWEKSNLGVGAQTIADMLTDAVAQVDALYKSDRSKNIVVCWGGHNDLYADRSATDIYTDISTYVTGRQSAGFKVIVGTIKPSSALTGDKETARVALNALIVTNTAGANAITDIASLAELQVPTNETYFADGTHLTNAGYAVVAIAFSETIGVV